MIGCDRVLEIIIKGGGYRDFEIELAS